MFQLLTCTEHGERDADMGSVCKRLQDKPPKQGSVEHSEDDCSSDGMNAVKLGVVDVRRRDRRTHAVFTNVNGTAGGWKEVSVSLLMCFGTGMHELKLAFLGRLVDVNNPTIIEYPIKRSSWTKLFAWCGVVKNSSQFRYTSSPSAVEVSSTTLNLRTCVISTWSRNAEHGRRAI